MFLKTFLYIKLITLVMPAKGGSLLERNFAKILENIGLNPVLNKRINGYEIDVYVEVLG